MSRAAAVNLCVAATIALVLAADSVGSRAQQAALGVAVAAALLLLLRHADRDERAIVLWCVAVSSAAELFCTQVWHLYGYRFGNVPLYVPPGHGLLCLAALWTGRSAVFARHGRLIRAVILSLCLGWVALGLFAAPVPDVEGALYLVFFLPLVLKSPRSLEWCWTFVLASLVELGGTAFGTWEWSPVQPWLGVPCANPPSAAAGGYCVFTFGALLCLALQRRSRLFAASTSGTA
ncbi:MAG: hypothetical protein IPJ65_07445 [Archangiaceae bacterium]|nr:hypothetical protein [Archangiaceae bacterium]